MPHGQTLRDNSILQSKVQVIDDLMANSLSPGVDYGLEENSDEDSDGDDGKASGIGGGRGSKLDLNDRAIQLTLV
jgi:hypothetical protein